MGCWRSFLHLDLLGQAFTVWHGLFEYVWTQEEIMPEIGGPGNYSVGLLAVRSQLNQDPTETGWRVSSLHGWRSLNSSGSNKNCIRTTRQPCDDKDLKHGLIQNGDEVPRTLSRSHKSRKMILFKAAHFLSDRRFYRCCVGISHHAIWCPLWSPVDTKER